MGFSFKILLIFSLFGSAQAQTRDGMRTLRFLSMAVRDRPPTVEEAQAFYRSEKTIEQLRDEWLLSPEHKDRVARYFSDMLGASNDFFVNNQAYFLEQNSSGIWYSPSKGDCAAEAAVSRTAWWKEASETISICSNIVSTQLSVTISGKSYSCTWDDGFLRAGCGCGPEQILCYPKSIRLALMGDLAHEFKDRAGYVYTQQLGWDDLLASSSVYGNRALAQFYLINQYIVPWKSAPSSVISKLRSIPMTEKVWFDTAGMGAPRAGIATSPAFMRRFNNGRSRIRALTDALLCHDVDGSLNTSGISTLVNTDGDDLGRSIVARPQCAVCHYGMDNLASTLFGWNDEGAFVRWPAQLSQAGHIFGQDGTGPAALMNGLIQRGPGFSTCMGKRAWEDISGRPWNALTSEEQADFEAAATPYALLNGIFQSKALLNARGASSDSLATDTIAFSEANPILQRSCSGASCHDADSSLGVPYRFIGDAEAFKKAPAGRLTDGTMPPASSGLTLPDSEKALLLQFIREPKQP